MHGISEQTIINYADGRVNTNSINYQSGYNSGISYADGRVNTSSINYSTGYNNGINYADGRVNTSSSSYTTGYNSGYSKGKNIISTLTKGELVLMLFFNDTSAQKMITQDEYNNIKVNYESVNQINFSRISSITIHTNNRGWSGNYYYAYFGGTKKYADFDSDVTIDNGHTNNNLSVVDQNGNASSYTIKSFTTTDGKVHSPSNLNY